ncbi:pentatricopeptide repeat-containing protein 1, mitochondrial [Elysia marginata]|uniref:Pentatricopeptide repeat-containing protein 1, mitochondrial n=1 Tax=Elysia marginata TaxID=1093978 RepID=A0AAV4HUX5_9GAST|nr:pentatricopeptide repeat-containing protein 1, mitochondrial [Elysia marginata]
MTLQQYVYFIHKSHTQLLSKFCKNSVAGLFPCPLSKGLRRRTFSNEEIPSDAVDSYAENNHANSNQQRKGARRIPEIGKSRAGLTERQEKSIPASDSVYNSKWQKVQGSAAARKYFKNTFLKKYPDFIQEAGKTKDDGANLFNNLSHSALSSHENNGRKYKDERDPNERLGEMLPEDVDELRDRRLNIPLTRDGRIGKNAYYYNRKISILGRQGKIKEAISVFDHWMMLRDRVMPNKRTFTNLIGILGRVGYTEKAFELYTKMRNLGLDPKDQVYTALFNACANSPWTRESLKQAENLLSSLQNKGIELNLITLKAAAKAMAFCGNFPRAFTIMDEASTYMSLDAECFDHLLMACAADKQSGFCRALQVWQKMQQFNVEPQTNTFNLLIRSMRDCEIGDPDNFARVLGLNDKESKLSGQIQFLKAGQSLQLNGENHRQLTLQPGETGQSDQMHSRRDPTNMNISGRHWCPNKTNEDFTEGLVSKQESHNLFHDIPNFDRDMEEFLTQRDVLREKSDSVDMYEWWEEQPTDVQQQLETQLSLRGQLDWTDDVEFNTGTSDTAVSVECDKDSNSNVVPETVYSERASEGVACMLETERYPSLPHFEQVHKLSKVPVSQAGVNDEELLPVKKITTPALRLALLGGARKLVLHMSSTGAAPDVRTFSQLVPCLPSTEQAENDLLQLMQEMGVVPDVDLINDLMLKRNLRHDSKSAKELLPFMSKLGLVPNMRTYAALALTCLKEHEAHRLLLDMKAANLEPNSEIMGHFIYISRTNFSYKLHMLQKMEWMDLSPKPKTIAVIEKSIAITKKNIIQAEQKKDKSSYYLSSEYQENFRKFLNFYKLWLQRTTLHKTHHPWDAFQRNKDEKEGEIKTPAT